MLAYELIEVRLRLFDELFRLAIENKCELFRRLEVLRRAGRPQIDLAGSKRSKTEFIQAKSGRAVHARVFSEEARLAVLKHNHCRPRVSGGNVQLRIEDIR